jgi:uncharacterized membrane protein YoaK (UPF0700 family)
MSGNTVGVTTHIALGEWAEVARRAFTIGAFAARLAIGASTVLLVRGRAPRLGFSITLAVEATLLGAMFAGGEAVQHGAREIPLDASLAYHTLVAAGAAAMGIQSATLRRAGPATARTTYVTGVMTRFVENLVRCFAALERDEAQRRAARAKTRILGGVWLAYATGGIASGLLAVHFGMRAVLLPLVGVLAAIALDYRLACRGAPGAGPQG